MRNFLKDAFIIFVCGILWLVLVIVLFFVEMPGRIRKWKMLRGMGNVK